MSWPISAAGRDNRVKEAWCLAGRSLTTPEQREEDTQATNRRPSSKFQPSPPFHKNMATSPGDRWWMLD